MSLSNDVLLHHIVPCMDPVAQHYCATEYGIGARQPLLLSERSELLLRAIKLGYPVKILESIDSGTDRLDKRHLSVAAEYASLDVLQWVAERVIIDKRALADCAFGGSLEKLDWLHQQQPTRESLVLASAIKKGHTHLLPFFAEHSYKIDFSVFIVACQLGDIAVIEWILKRQSINTNQQYLRVAILQNHVHLVRYLLDNQLSLATTTGLQLACSQHRMDIGKLLKERGAKLDMFCAITAIKKGYNDMLEWMAVDCKLRFDPDCLATAINAGDLSMIVWMESLCELQVKTGLDRNRLRWKAKNVKIEVVQWLYEEGWLFDTDGLYCTAAQHGAVDVIRWLVSQQVPLGTNFHWLRFADVTTAHLCVNSFPVGCLVHQPFTAAIGVGNYEVVEWFLDNQQRPELRTLSDAFRDYCSIEMCSSLVAAEHYDLLDLLHTRGYRLDFPLFLRYMKRRHSAPLSICQWLAKWHYPLNQELFELALRYDHQTAKWMKEHEPNLIVASLAHFHFHTYEDVQWLIHNGLQVNEFVEMAVDATFIESSTLDPDNRKLVVSFVIESIKHGTAKQVSSMCDLLDFDSPNQVWLNHDLIGYAEERGNKNILQLVRHCTRSKTRKK